MVLYTLTVSFGCRPPQELLKGNSEGTAQFNQGLGIRPIRRPSSNGPHPCKYQFNHPSKHLANPEQCVSFDDMGSQTPRKSVDYLISCFVNLILVAIFLIISSSAIESIFTYQSHSLFLQAHSVPQSYSRIVRSIGNLSK